MNYKNAYEEMKRLYDKLQQESNQLKDKINTYENPEDLTLMFMYCDEKAKDKIKQLKELINGIREERDYLFNKSSVENKQIQQEKDLYKSVIEEVREYVNTPWILADYETGEQIHKKKKELLQILDKAKDVK